ncbi:hypothetical protein HDU91_005169, partial [Kappamyces sp. JEL0680]
MADRSSLLFLKFWKRRNNCLAFLWDAPLVDSDHVRTEWKPSKSLEYSYVSGQSVPYESIVSKALKRMVSASALVLCFAVVSGTVAIDAVLYAYVSNQLFFGTSVPPSYGLVGSIGIVAVFAVVHLLLVERILDVASILATQHENHKQLSHHKTQFSYSQFFLQFFNSFGLLLFLALVRPILSQSSTIGYYYGSLTCATQGYGST